ncbi:hypothetical protein TIFTF001_029706 [Ficus carica]|uniref:Uncharacterized protein n=1 Tax=Ficus carica TaxID=3494 RepID=A0AA88DS23_FICCA|nr:hypothetical protein TIFTF001_029706 [Ficus carica]
MSFIKFDDDLLADDDFYGFIKFDDDLLADDDFYGFFLYYFCCDSTPGSRKWVGAWLDVGVELLVVVELSAGGRAVVSQVREGEPPEVSVELVDGSIVGQWCCRPPLVRVDSGCANGSP